MRFPAVQVAVNVFTVCVVPAVNFTVLPGFILKSLNTLDPCIVSVPAPVFATQTLFQVSPPSCTSTSYQELSASFSVDVPGFNVNPVALNEKAL
jgi:hypothetical protein